MGTIYIPLCLSFVGFLINDVTAQTRTEFVQALLVNYDSRIPPNFEHNNYTEVFVQLYINSIDNINEQTMDFSLDVLIHQEWVDTRLNFHGLIPAEYLELDARLMKDVWVPDLYFTNEKRASFHDVTVPNRMLHLFQDGTIKYRSRVSLTAACPMLLHKYPMDRQICSLYLQSFAFSTNRLRFAWKNVEHPVRTNPLLALPQFTLDSIQTDTCTGTYGEGNFTCLRVDFYLQRNIGFYMIQIYVPSMLIVLLSWVSFWLNVDAVPARISLGILTVLTMTTQKSMAVSSLPRVSYIKAIDTWMAACLCFVFAALLEFALVNVMDRRQIKKGTGYVQKASDGNDVEAAKGALGRKQTMWTIDPVVNKRAKRVDNISRLLFPGGFILFCILYWTIYSKG